MRVVGQSEMVGRDAPMHPDRIRTMHRWRRSLARTLAISCTVRRRAFPPLDDPHLLQQQRRPWPTSSSSSTTTRPSTTSRHLTTLARPSTATPRAARPARLLRQPQPQLRRWQLLRLLRRHRPHPHLHPSSSRSRAGSSAVLSALPTSLTRSTARGPFVSRPRVLIAVDRARGSKHGARRVATLLF